VIYNITPIEYLEQTLFVSFCLLESRILKFKLLSSEALAPSRGSPYSAGLDLHSAQNIVLQPKAYTTIDTGIKIFLPQGWYGQIVPRSGLMAKHGVRCSTKTIDNDNEQERIMVVLFNHGKRDVLIHQGDRIAQLVFGLQQRIDHLVPL
jgi:deoxyuridine 5'-triphosphate nucleotidohydrolase